MTRLLLIAATLLAAAPVGSFAQDRPGRVVASVDRQEITDAQVRVRLILERAGDSPSAAVRARVIDDLIDRLLLRQFLAKKGVKVPDDLVDEQRRVLADEAATRKLDLAAELGRIGYTEAALKEDLWLPIAWSMHVRRETTDEQLTEFFATHKSQFDGTTRHVRHLFVKGPAEGDPKANEAAKASLEAIRSEIVSGTSTFAEAARKNSESPSGEKGGDLGFVHFRGDLPPSVAEAAFALQLKEVSPVVASPYGLHLVTVEEDKSGDLSLEDVRPDVLEALSRERWKAMAAELRGKAKIKIVDSP